jgi:hypothetical protein
MPKAAAHPTSFHNLSDGELVDGLGALKAEAAALKAREDALKAELIGRHVAAAEGAAWRAAVLPASIRWTLDAEAVRAAMGEAWVLRHSKRSPVKPTARGAELSEAA